MPGLKQADRIEYELLRKHLATHGYVPDSNTPELSRHITCSISFMLCVDDFGIKYVGKQHATQLLNDLKEQYDISIDQKGSLYYSLTIAWN